MSMNFVRELLILNYKRVVREKERGDGNDDGKT